jgi:hypothetical protein
MVSVFIVQSKARTLVFHRVPPLSAGTEAIRSASIGPERVRIMAA